MFYLWTRSCDKSVSGDLLVIRHSSTWTTIDSWWKNSPHAFWEGRTTGFLARNLPKVVEQIGAWIGLGLNAWKSSKLHRQIWNDFTSFVQRELCMIHTTMEQVKLWQSDDSWEQFETSQKTLQSPWHKNKSVALHKVKCDCKRNMYQTCFKTKRMLIVGKCFCHDWEWEDLF